MPKKKKEKIPEDNILDGCELDFTVDPTPDDEVDLLTLFAEALNPNNPKTVEEAEAEWRELFNV